MKIIASLLRLFSLSNVQEVLLVGRVPVGLERLGEGVQAMQCRLLVEVPSLEALLNDDRPTVTAMVVAQGLPSGILVESGADRLLSEGWWRSSDFFEVILFCFSCYSADHISSSDMNKMIHGAIGFEGAIWISVADGGAHLIPFLRKVKKILHKNARNVEQSFSRIVAEYARVILSLSRKEGRVGGGDGEVYLQRICMLRQMQQVKLLPSRGSL